MAESLFFFVVPDVGVGLVALFSIRHGFRALLAAIAGSLVGGLLLFLAISGGFVHGVEHYLVLVPGIHQSMIDTARQQIAQYGSNALFAGPLQGIPYKVYVSELTLAGISWPMLLLWSIPARAMRILPATIVFAVGGRVLHSSIERHPVLWVSLYGLAWLAVYVAYFTFLH
jgi:hypothetical protein